MVDIKKFLKLNTLTIGLVILAVLLILVPITYSKLTSAISSDTDISTAFYVIGTNYESKSIKFDNLVPRSEGYVYNFTVSNNDGKDRCETDMEYTLKVTTTTNLPLTYSLYLNELYTDTGASSIFTSDTIDKDEDGTYFRNMLTDKREFTFKKDMVDTYQLVINFPLEYDDFKYQDVVEGIIISIDSKQIIEENDG